MSKRYSGKSFKDSSVMKKPKLTFKEKKKLKEEKKNCQNVDIINAQINKSATSTDNVAGQLKILKEMYDSGDLTREEYTKAKKKVLD